MLYFVFLSFAGIRYGRRVLYCVAIDLTTFCLFVCFNQVMNMVRPNISNFRDIYTPLLAHMPTLTRATVSISSQQGEITKITHSIHNYVGLIERKQNEEWAKEEEIVFKQVIAY